MAVRVVGQVSPFERGAESVDLKGPRLHVHGKVEFCVLLHDLERGECFLLRECEAECRAIIVRAEEKIQVASRWK